MSKKGQKMSDIFEHVHIEMKPSKICLLRQINCEIGNINVSGLVKKYNRLKKLSTLTPESEKGQLLNNTKFTFLDEAYLRH